VVKASDEFKEEVVGDWLNGRIAGTKGNQCWNCHELRMKLLFAKMKDVDAQGLATGHLAKLFRQESHHSVYLHTSNDEVHDQSGLLSRVPHEILDKLMLPLSDLQQKEINKLAENFGLTAEPKKINMHDCFDIPYEEKGYLESNIPKRYQKAGELVGLDKTTNVEHLGIQHYKYGEPFPVPNQKSNDLFYVSKYTVSDKKLEVSKADHFIRKSLFLTQCKISDETSWAEPLKGVLKINENDSSECWIYPKNLSSAVIELETPLRVLEGDIVTILKKKGKNSKVYLTGKVRYIPDEKPVMEQGKERVKVDYTRDF
jgi:tRNA-specific 2-thiouridylase